MFLPWKANSKAMWPWFGISGVYILSKYELLKLRKQNDYILTIHFSKC